MSSRIARAIIRMTVAAAIAPFSVGEIGGAAAQPSATRLAAQECLTNGTTLPSPRRMADTQDGASAAKPLPRPGCWGSRLVAQVLTLEGCLPRRSVAHLTTMLCGFLLLMSRVASIA